ncbi:rubrerythrin [Pseudanabaena phage Pam4]|nr:rubrerythrin [Pseudanabaena phage Pam4]
MTSTTFYTTAAGESRTTCGEHRTLGYAYAGLAAVLACRGCGRPASQHETTDETVARRRAEAGAR